jgi:hypothetical protein
VDDTRRSVRCVGGTGFRRCEGAGIGDTCPPFDDRASDGAFQKLFDSVHAPVFCSRIL